MLPHSKSYQITRLKKRGDIEVVQQCLVAFSIGRNFSNEILSDIVENEAYHLLFGGHGNLTIKLSTLEEEHLSFLQKWA